VSERRDDQWYRQGSSHRYRSPEVRLNRGARGLGGVPQTGRVGDDWQVVRPRCGKALRQDEDGQDGQ